MAAKANMREKIMEAAEVVFAEKGYHDAAMDDIVRRTEISKGGLYFHFASKERLFFAVMDHLADRLLNRVKLAVERHEGSVERLQEALGTVMDSLTKRRRLAKLLLVQGYSMGNSFQQKRMEIFTRFALVIRENLDLAVREGVIPPQNTEISAYVWAGAINEVVIRWVYTGKPDPMKESLPVLSRMLLDGVGVKIELVTGER